MIQLDGERFDTPRQHAAQRALPFEKQLNDV
jgi:hypothetical protein